MNPFREDYRMSATKITSAALHTFALKGYEGAALSEIAKQVGVKTPSLYAHFRSKQEMFLTVYELVLQEYAHRLEQRLQASQQEAMEQRMFQLLKDSCSHELLSEHQMSFLKRTLLFPPDFLEEELRQRFIAVEQKLSEQLLSIFAAASAAGEIPTVSASEALTSYYCLMDGCFMQSFLYGRELFEQRLPAIWRIYWRGLAGK
jgi:AcrR family transcriptional regulator